MIFHTDCKSNVYIDTSEGVKILSCLGLTGSGVSSGLFELVVVSKKIPLKFFCLECNRQVENTDIVILCGVCGEFIPLHESWLSIKSGGLYCETDIKKLFDVDSIHPVREILTDIVIQQGG